MTTNLDGCFVTIRECMKSMSETDWGRVIAVSSIAGLRGLRALAPIPRPNMVSLADPQLCRGTYGPQHNI